METKQPSTPMSGVRTMASDKKHVLDDSGIVFSDHGTKQGAANAQTLKKPADTGIFDVSSAFRGETEMGTFVTDKKRKHRTLFGVLREAAGEWTKDKTDTVKNMEVFQKPEVPTVAPGTKRKDILEKAIQNKAALPRDDHKVVIERIKTLEHDAERVTGKPFQIKPKEERSVKAGWSHVAETNAPTSSQNAQKTPETGRIIADRAIPTAIRRAELTPDAADQNAAPHVDERINKPIDDYIKKPATPEAVNRADIASSSDIGGIAKETDKRTEARVFDEKLVEPKESNLEERWQNFAKKELPKEIPLQAPPPRTPETPATTSDTAIPHRSPLRLLIIVLIIVIAIGSGLGGVLLLVTQKEPGKEVVPTIVVAGGTFIPVDERVSMPLSADRTSLLTTLTEKIKSSVNKTIVVDFTVPSGEHATTDEFFAVLDPRAPGAFIRSLDPEMMVGGVPGAGPAAYFIFKTDSYDTAFAGMLEWELSMSADLAPLFGMPVSRSKSQDARTSDQTTSALFTDEKADDYNVRVLLDEMENERIVYGILGIDTLIITSSRTAFLELASALK